MQSGKVSKGKVVLVSIYAENDSFEAETSAEVDYGFITFGGNPVENMLC